ncbi:unnamed protein product [Thelazia callipaeda]|uniref:LITAF domain-containing protein n=1 Tax=Thelazia callipaeda TaxID=103827 RepID=A0A0N5CZB5_THECL|nr:unnamed protein product [Thelazia callipaeda]
MSKYAVDKILDDDLERSNGTNSNNLDVQLVDAGHCERIPNRLYVTRNVVCGKLLNGSVAVLLYHHESDCTTEVSSTAAYALGFYRIPTIGIGLRDAEFSRKIIYPTFMRTSPSHSNEAHVILRLLAKLAYRQTVIVYVKGDVDALDFVNVFEENRQQFEIHVQKYIELELNSLINDTTIDEYFEGITSNVIILFAKKNAAQKIFETIRILSAPGKVCIVNQLATDISNLPSVGCLSTRLRQTSLSALREALLVVRHSFAFLSDREVQPPQLCENIVANSKWINGFGIRFYKHLISSVVYDDYKIEFNNEGERLNVAYDVINYVEGKFHTVGYMNSDNAMILNETQIIWLGNSIKPSEITLAKYLRVVTVADAPFVYVIPITELTNCSELGNTIVDDIDVAGPWYNCSKRINESTIDKYCCAGYAIDLLFYLSLPQDNGIIDTGFTFDIHLNDTYGTATLGEIGYTLSGMVGELDTDLADLAIGALTINVEREKYIDFSEPWLYHGIRILEKWKPRDSSMESFVQPLKTSLWTALLISVMFIGCFIFLLDFCSPFDQLHQTYHYQQTDNRRVTLGEALWFVSGVLLNSGVVEKTPRSCSARVLGIVWCGFCMIMVASYTANLAAFLVLDQPEKGLTGVNDPRVTTLYFLEQVIPQKLRNPSANFSFATVLDTNTYQYFKRHVELSTMHRNMEAHNVRVAAHAIQALINETLDAFIWDSTRLEFEAAKNCELRTRGTLFGRSAYGVGLQKNSPWTSHITNAVLRLIEKLYTKWVALNHQNQCEPETQKSPARLGFANMRDVFILVTGGIIVSSLLIFAEIRYDRKKVEKKKKRDLALRFARKWRAFTRRKRNMKSQNILHSDQMRSTVITEMKLTGKFLSILHKQANTILTNRHFKGASTIQILTLAREGCLFTAAVVERNLSLHVQPICIFKLQNLVKTETFAVVGLFAYIWLAIFVLLFMWPCAPLPCYMSCFADYIHICPMCRHKIGRYKRGFSSRFYV